MTSRPYSNLMTLFLTVGMALVVATSLTSVWAQESDAATIRTVQRALAAKGHNPGPVDGLMGPRTRAALEGFQEAQGIRVTGKIDDPTLQALGITQNRDNVVQRAGRATAQGAKAAGSATARGATTVAKTTARGATSAAKTTAGGTKKGATVAAQSTKQGATVAAQSTKKGATVAAGSTVKGAQTVGRTTTSGAKRASDEVRGVLGLGVSDEAIQRNVTKHLEEDEIIDASRVRVSVKSGVVTLAVSGLSLEDQDRAAAIARRVNAVKDVVVKGS